jgi:pyruvate dehydrogenase E2 component (dihydrolipoamide acetyltransferase)
MGFETPEEGYLAKILLPGGSKEIPIGKLLCIIVANKEDVEKFASYKADDAAGAKAAPEPAKVGTVTECPITRNTIFYRLISKLFCRNQAMNDKVLSFMT